MADTQLLPCPFCGGTDLSIETNSVQPDDFHDAWVNCGECNADGRHAMTLEGWLPSKAEAKEEAVVAWNRRAALASRPAEVDDMMPVTEPVAWRHTLDEGSYFANGRNYQLLDDWDAAFADWMLHGGVLESLYSGPDTHELKKEGDEVATFEKNLRKSQVPMDPEIASVLGDNLWDLYESDQEDLLPLPQGVAVMTKFPLDQAASRYYTPYRPAWLGSFPPTGSMLYTAEQYRQGQRDAVAADRARRGSDQQPAAWALVSPKGGIKKVSITRGSVESRMTRWLEEWPDNKPVIRPLVFGDFAPSHTTNKEKKD